jgi:broad specificity phosphatase PhoE/predicted kinase
MRRPKREKLVLVMVGLPARGKTYLARKMARYLTWRGYQAKVFNVGNYRRRNLGSHHRHAFFDPTNPEGLAARLKMALMALDDLFLWLQEGGDVAIYDATNSSRSRRALIQRQCEEHGVLAVFVESICTEASIVESNIRETKLRSPDYVGAAADAAVSDFRARIAHYESAYEPVRDDVSYIKVVNVGEQIVVNRIRGYLPGRLVYLLMNLHIQPRRIWFSRHGQSEYNVESRIGGDPPLTAAGREYAQGLKAWFADRREEEDAVKVWTSTLTRALQTVKVLEHPFESWKALDEIEAGIGDGLTYEEMAARYPEEYAARSVDKLRYRYPRGESYEDVIRRLEPVIIELERQRGSVLVVAHQAVLRALYAYFADHEPDDCPFLEMPLHAVIELQPKAYGCAERRFDIGPLTGRDKQESGRGEDDLDT